jgi:chemotaxis methyl-accepting protein methylase
MLFIPLAHSTGSSLRDGVVVDVGGSAGLVSKAIAATAPRLRFIVQDQPSMVAKGQAELEPELEGRVTFQSHNFVDPHPVQTPDCFLFRLILHDWPDSDVIAILRQLVPSLDPKTRILIQRCDNAGTWNLATAARGASPEP